MSGWDGAGGEGEERGAGDIERVRRPGTCVEHRTGEEGIDDLREAQPVEPKGTGEVVLYATEDGEAQVFLRAEGGS